MNRPQARNAQNMRMTYDLNAAFDLAVADEAIRVIIVAGEGPHFSSGHDLRERAAEFSDPGVAMGVRGVEWFAHPRELGSRKAKEAVNRTLDIMGQANAIDSAFGPDPACHAHNMIQFGLPVDPSGLPAALKR